MNDVEESPEEIQERAREVWGKVKTRLALYLAAGILILVVGGTASAMLWGWPGFVVFAFVALGLIVWIGRQLLYY